MSVGQRRKRNAHDKLWSDGIFRNRYWINTWTGLVEGLSVVVVVVVVTMSCWPWRRDPIRTQGPTRSQPDDNRRKHSQDMNAVGDFRIG